MSLVERFEPAKRLKYRKEVDTKCCSDWKGGEDEKARCVSDERRDL